MRFTTHDPGRCRWTAFLHCWAVLAIWLAGCRGDSKPAPTIPHTGREIPWADQIEAVRAGRSREIHLERQILGPSEWAALDEGCAGLTALDVAHAQVADSDLHLLAALPQLTRLRLEAPIGDAGLGHLAECPNLAVLNLPAAGFTDAGLERLTHLPRLELLRFHSPHVTDAGLAHIAGIRANGAAKHFGHLAKPYKALAPIEFITQYLSRPASLALRLFGNIFAGGIMVSVIALIPPYLLWLPNAGWKLFDMFVGVIQALIFTLLTLIYFSEAVGSEDEHAH